MSYGIFLFSNLFFIFILDWIIQTLKIKISYLIKNLWNFDSSKL